MNYVYALVILLIISRTLAAQDLDFQSTGGGWTAGALSKSYTHIGSPASKTANVTVTMGGVTSGFQSNSPQAFSRGLQLGVNFASNTDCVTMTVTFSPGIQGLTFKLLNVDKGATSGSANTFVDQVTISGKYNTTSVTPTISASGTAGTYSTISGNVITGTGDAPSSSADPGNKVTFAGTVTEVTITYCNDAANTAANPGTQTITVEDFSWTATTPLPVQLLSFQGKPIGNQVALLWETAWEQNSDYFEVQRSRDAQEFVSIGRVAALDESNSRHSYSLLDQNPIAGVGYYRLKQVDKGEQQTTYSRIIAVALDDITPALAVTGNPVVDGQIRFVYRNIDPQSIQLQTHAGVPVPGQVIRESEMNAVFIPNQPLSTGLYLLKSQNGMQTIKLIVL